MFGPALVVALAILGGILDTGNIGLTLAVLGIVLWIVGSVVPEVAGFKFGTLAAIGKPIFWVGVAIFILLLII